ncbi:MAG TPA: hypothetical protein VFD03_05260, partial [Clostridia bacterium]|nr:hypothetical protein [Clostridia bacterium]
TADEKCCFKCSLPSAFMALCEKRLFKILAPLYLKNFALVLITIYILHKNTIAVKDNVWFTFKNDTVTMGFALPHSGQNLPLFSAPQVQTQ